MAYELIGAEQVVELVTARKISIASYPKGVRYLTASGQPATFDLERWYFETPVSGSWIRVNQDLACERIVTADITRYIGTNVSNIGGVRIYRDTDLVSPDMDLSMVDENYRVGQSTMVLGTKTACAGPKSIVQGSNVCVDRTSSYVMVDGANSVVKGSRSVLGTFFDSAVNNVEDSVIQMDGASAKGVYGSVAICSGGGRISDIQSSVLSSGGHSDVEHAVASLLLGASRVETSQVSESILAASDNMAVSGLRNSLILGSIDDASTVANSAIASVNARINQAPIANSAIYGDEFETAEHSSIRNILAHGAKLHNGFWSDAQRVYLKECTDGVLNSETEDILSIGDENNILYPGASAVSVIGSGNTIGWWSEYTNADLSYQTKRIYDGSVHGRDNNVGYGTESFAIYGSSNYIPSKSANILVIGDDFNYYRNGYEPNRFTSPLTTVTVDELISLASQGRTGMYAVVSKNVDHVTIGETTVNLRRNNLTAYVSITGVNRITDGTGIGSEPELCNNILSIGTKNSISSGAQNSVLIGDNILLSCTGLKHCVIADDNITLDSTSYIDHVWWLGDRKRGNVESPLEQIKSNTNPNKAYADAFVFASRNINRSEFYGIFSNPTQSLWGFESSTVQHAKKPDTSMIYVGGIALGGMGRDADTDNDCDYGLLKIGQRFDSKTAVQNYKTNDPNFGKKGYSHYICTGTDDCVYAGMSLVIQDKQEWDGTYRIKPQKIDSRGLDMDDLAQKLGAYGGGTGILSKFGVSAYISLSTNKDFYEVYNEHTTLDDDYDPGEGYTTSSYVLKSTHIKNGGIYSLYLPNKKDTYPYDDRYGISHSVSYVREWVKLPDPTEADLGKQFIIVLPMSDYNIFSTVFYKGMTSGGVTSEHAVGTSNDYYSYLLPPASFNWKGNGFGGMSNGIKPIKVSGDYTTYAQDALSGTSEMQYATLFTVIQIPKMKNGSRYDNNPELDYCYVTQSLGIFADYYHWRESE